ncbi:hypothetical protein KCTC52924_03770 [Arenibacter antarcticus]|uniref:Uncharacterized protein n=1 Tax=Arenibacter antarcticus TaxID=2040469 RepID=A0ABW5VHJ0_9FLAO|nr:hypothetical protein [Arenibacter sp. H213]MCM4168208.1 hypothetical protein [Arenibacter sp. H213]
MSKIFSIALSLLLLFQSLHLDMVNVAQLDDFLTHANFHKQKYGDNLFDFVSKHYGSLKEQHYIEHQEEHKDHEDLPFNHQSCIHSTTAFVLNEDSLMLAKTPHAIDTISGFFYEESYEQIMFTDIFQPPKQV